MLKEIELFWIGQAGGLKKPHNLYLYFYCHNKNCTLYNELHIACQAFKKIYKCK